MQSKQDEILDAEKLADIERKYDPETPFRPMGKNLCQRRSNFPPIPGAKVHHSGFSEVCP